MVHAPEAYRPGGSRAGTFPPPAGPQFGHAFGTFQLTDEGIDAPVRALREARAEAGIAEEEFDVLGFGETREYAVA